MHRLPCGLVLLLLFVADCVLADSPERRPHRRPERRVAAASEPFDGEPIHSGILIDDGVYVSPPYTVAWSGTELLLNGRPLPRQLADARDDEESDGPMSRGRRGFNSSSQMAGRMERQLSQGVLVVRTAGGNAAIFSDLTAVEVLETLCSVDAREKQVATLLATPGQSFDSRDWGRIVDRFEVSADVQSVLAQLRSDCDKLFSGMEIVHDGVGRSHSYALTVAGMLLAVVGFGTVLTLRPTTGRSWSSIDNSRSAVSVVTRCALLIAVLSGFDLLCTILAGESSQFRELNPLASTLLGSTASLIGFKLAFTGLAVWILCYFRRYRGMQVASWWICLLLTLLTVRWVAVESLLMA